MRDEANRLAALLANGKCGIDGNGKALRFFFDRTSPIESKLDHLMGVGEERFEVIVSRADGTIGLHAIRHAGGVLQPRQSVDETPAQPDALAIDFEIASED